MSADPYTVDLDVTLKTSCLVQPPSRPTDGPPPLLVALHGQGESGERHANWLRGAVPEHFVAAFPDGFHKHEVRRPERPIRIGCGWYLFTGDQEAFAESLAESEAALWRLIDVVLMRTGADPSRLYLMGFSQGCYLTHCVAVRGASRIAGWIGQAGRLKHEFLLDENGALPGVTGKPVLIQHGRSDEALKVEAAEHSAEILRDSGADVTCKLYDAGHRITPEMVTDMRAWLEAQAPA